MKHSTIDKVATFSSLLCSIHCCLMPLLLIILPFGIMEFIANETAEKVFIGISCLLALASICYGYSKHRRKTVLFLVSLGILTLVIAHHYSEESQHSTASSLLMGLGGIQLAVSHYLNLRFCKSCTKCTH